MTIVLIVGELRTRAVHCLASLLAQDCIESLDILLIDLAAATQPPLPGSAHPAVRRVTMPPDTPFSIARRRAVGMTEAPVIAFAEEHCRMLPGWARALIEAHAASDCAAVGAEVRNANPESRLSRTIELMNYNLWMPPATRGEFHMLPGHNSSFKRAVLLEYGDELETLLRAEVALYLRLFRDGRRLLLEPEAKFEHLNETRLASICRGYFLWHRCYGPVRAAIFRWSMARRWLYIVATPAIPLYYLVRLTGVLARRRPRLLPAMLRGIPAIVIAQLAAAAGQAAGLLFGPGDAEQRFTQYELCEPRDTPPPFAPLRQTAAGQD